MDKDYRPFSQMNLKNQIKQMGEDVLIETKVQEFLVDIGNEFLEKVMIKSESISDKIGENGKKVIEPTDVKFVLKTLYDIDLGKKSFDEVNNMELKKSGKEKSAKQGGNTPDDKIID